MGSRWGWVALVVLAVCLMAPGAEARPQKGKVFDNWKINCQTGEDNQEKCVAMLIGLSQDGRQVFDISFGFLGPNGEAVVVVTLPLGISLRDGGALKIDERPLLPLTLNTCRPDGCEAVAPLDDATLRAVLAAKTLAIGVVPYRAKQPLGIPVPVKGLAAAVNSLR